MPKGPLGAPRPFSEYRLLIDLNDQDVTLLKVGPFGGPRPFAKDNPPVQDERVAECMLSDSGRAFGAGVVTRGGTTDIGELPPEQQQEAIELAEKWCRGTLESAAIENLEEDEMIPALSRIRNTLAAQTGSTDSITIDLTDDEGPFDPAAEL